MNSTLVHALALFGAISLLVSFAIAAFFLWFTYDTRKTSKSLDEMQDGDEN